MKKSIEQFHVLPKYWESWGSTVDEKTVVTLDDVKTLAREWDKTVDELLEQLEPILRPQKYPHTISKGDKSNDR